MVPTFQSGVDTETIIEGIAARTNPRYQKTHVPIPDQHPALTRNFERVLLLIKQNKPHPAVPKGRLKDLHAKFADAGKCQALPIRHQNNGDIQERDYDVVSSLKENKNLDFSFSGISLFKPFTLSFFDMRFSLPPAAKIGRASCRERV